MQSWFELFQVISFARTCVDYQDNHIEENYIELSFLWEIKWKSRVLLVFSSLSSVEILFPFFDLYWIMNATLLFYDLHFVSLNPNGMPFKTVCLEKLLLTANKNTCVSCENQWCNLSFTVQEIPLYLYLRNVHCLACVHPGRDARGWLGEHEGNVRDCFYNMARHFSCWKIAFSAMIKLQILLTVRVLTGNRTTCFSKTFIFYFYFY